MSGNFIYDRLGDHVSIRTGKLDANASSVDGDYPFFTCSREPLRISSFSYDCECVLVAGNGDLNVKYYNGKFDAYQRTYILVSKDKSALDTRYLFRWMSVYVERLRTMSVGGVIKYIKLGHLADAQIPLPSLREQQRIAAILDKADGLRDKRRAALTRLDALTQAIFFDLFGDPAVNSKSWPVKAFGSEVVSVRYGTGSPPDYVDEGLPFIRATNVKGGTISPKDLKRIPKTEAERLEKCRVKKGDLIVVRSGVNTGDCALIPPEYDAAYAAFDLVVQLPFSSAVFYNYLINSKYGKTVLAPLTRRAAQPHLNAEQLKSLTFISPPEALREEFANRVGVIAELRASHISSLAQMDALFAALQHRAFRGEL